MAQPAPFGLNGTTTKVTSSGATSSGSISMGGNTSVMVTNAGTVLGFIRSSKGASSAVVTDTPVVPGSQCFSIPLDHDTVSVISSSATSIDVYFTVGSGS